MAGSVPNYRFIVGLTGGIGSGKTAASDYFTQRGVAVVDADVAARAVVQPGGPALAEITRHFGKGILLDGGHLNRAKLRAEIFQDTDKRRWINNLLHPLINQLIENQLQESNSSYVVLATPLLFETGQFKMVHRTVLIDLPESLQIRRASARDGVTADDIKQIIRTQMSREERLTRANDVVDNSGTIEQLHRQLDTLHRNYSVLSY